jgi:hypothetical protein
MVGVDWTMTEYSIQPHTRRCAITGRELRPGEKFFTVLVEEDGQFVRKDFSGEVWQGPPGEVNFWSGRVPRDAEAQKPHFDDELLLDCFHRLEGQDEPRKVNFRYVVALLLMRRKRFRFLDARLVQGREVLVVASVRDKNKYEVVNPHLSETEIVAVQEEVFRVLGWN